MGWLKTIIDLQGSVEKSSLAQAKRINEVGFYEIGKESGDIPNVNNCLKLIIPQPEYPSGLLRKN